MMRLILVSVLALAACSPSEVSDEKGVSAPIPPASAPQLHPPPPAKSESPATVSDHSAINDALTSVESRLKAIEERKIHPNTENSK
jgi:hypothetical protein